LRYAASVWKSTLASPVNVRRPSREFRIHPDFPLYPDSTSNPPTSKLRLKRFGRMACITTRPVAPSVTRRIVPLRDQEFVLCKTFAPPIAFSACLKIFAGD
jgi:hypothetical protein